MTMTATAAAKPRRSAHRHATAEERAAAGRAARAVAPRARWLPGRRHRTGNRRSRRCSGRTRPGCRARPDPLRTDGRVSVLVLPRRGRDHGRRPRRRRRAPDSTCSCAVTPTCRTSARSRRPIGGSCSASTTSTRPSRDRSSGTSSGSSPASPSPGGRSGFTPPKRRAIVLAAAARLPARRCATFAGMSSLDVWYTRLDVDEHRPALRRRAPAAGSGTCSAPSTRRQSKDSLQAMAKLTRGRRRHAPSSSTIRPMIVRLDELVGAGRGRAPQARRTSCCGPTRRRSRRPAGARRALPLRRHRPQGRRRRQRRHAGLGRADARPRRRDPLLLQVKEAQASVLEPYLGASRYKQPRPARRRGPAADAGGERHPARLAADATGSTASTRDFFVRQLWDKKGSADVEDGHRRDADLRRALRRGPWPGPTPAPATPSPSRPTSADRTPSTGRWPTSPRPTPTRTSATTPRCARRSPTGRSPRRSACDRGRRSPPQLA